MIQLRKDWLIWLVLLIPFVFLAIYWDKFPAEIATHFDFNGKPNGTSSKTFGLLIIPLMNIGMYFLFIYIPNIDPSRSNYILFETNYDRIRLAIHIFLLYIFCFIATYGLGYHENLTLFLFYGILIFLLILGRAMKTIKHNYFIGIRTPWTLANEEVWDKTHVFTSKVWTISTIMMMVLLSFLPMKEIMFMVFIAIIVLIPVVFSYLEFRKIQNKS